MAAPVTSGLGGPPIVNRILGEPDGDVSAVAQCVVVLSPMGSLVKSLFYLVVSVVATP